MSDLYMGDCREIRTALPDNSVDTIITDPPYGLEFMGKGWDKGVPGVEFWREFLAVAKPGAMLLAFGGTRTFHRMTCAIEDAGWEIRDCMMWLYGSGFPKSLDISKAIDKAKGAKRLDIGPNPNQSGRTLDKRGGNLMTPKVVDDCGDHSRITAPATDLAREWSGWGTALKPAWEPIILAMKPLDGTFAENAEKWGVAGINVDGGRIETFADSFKDTRPDKVQQNAYGKYGTADYDGSKGRWPANLLLDEDAAAMLDEQVHSSGARCADGDSTGTAHGRFVGWGQVKDGSLKTIGYGKQNGGASRFFYVAKASKSERNAGCEAIAGGCSHPTVKPLKLMEYLCTLSKTPTGGVVLDPFAGSGTTLLAAKNTGREYIGIEQNAEYFSIIKARLGVA